MKKNSMTKSIEKILQREWIFIPGKTYLTLIDSGIRFINVRQKNSHNIHAI